MAFIGFDEENGDAVYDTKEAAIERARQMLAWQGEPGDVIFVHREHVPVWFAHLVRDTPFQWLAYSEVH